MALDQFGAKPAVLRCTRCGTFVDWGEARVLFDQDFERTKIVSTTNDNLPALYFYQRRGYRLTHLVPDNVLLHTHQVVARFAGIPTCDEIRLEKRIR
jgi:hypothetical protein